MSELNRNQFKGSTLNSIKEEQGRAEKALPVVGYSDSRPGFHTIVEGKNWRRIAPAHNPNEPAYRAKSSVSLDCEVAEVDGEGKETGKKEVKRKQIFIATQHSSVMTEDPIVTYISFVQKRANDEIQDKDARSKFMAPITGWRGKDGKWNWGIKPSIEYICYCWDEKGTLGREQLYSSMLDDMKKLSVAQADDNAEIIPDIFTDPDEGYPLIITKELNDKKKFETTVSCELPTKKETWVEFFNRVRITDEQLVDFMSKESLAELYKDVYTTRDFNMAIDGLRRFDIANKYEIFENEEFLERLEKIKATVPIFKPKDAADNDPVVAIQNTPKPQPKVAAPVETPKVEVPKTEPTTVTPIAMKRALKAYIIENYGDDATLPELSREDLVKWYNLSLEGEELPFTEEQTETKESVYVPAPAAKVETPAPAVETPVITGNTNVDPDLQAQIDALRKRRQAK